MEWFATWFDSPYYHLLYRNRNTAEAEVLMQTIARSIHLAPGQRVLDLACGSGRHSVSLAQMGFQLTGIDLSPESIHLAQERAETEGLNIQFLVGDMRRLPFQSEFDAVLNLFTSFGYFSNLDDNLAVLQGVKRALRPGGWLVLDFLNAELVLRMLKPEEEKMLEGVHFRLRKQVVEGCVVKDIQVEDKGKTYDFRESVQLFRLSEFETLFQEAGLQLEFTQGGYQGTPFDPETSERLLLYARA